MRASAGKRSAAPIDRCAECGASYARFRGGMSREDASWILTLQATMNAGYEPSADPGTLDAESVHRRECDAGASMRLAGEIKRAAWHEAHGPGRCCFDVEGFIIDYRRSRSSIAVDHEWALRELIADLLLGDEDTADDDSVDVEITFDTDEFSAVPEYIDDGQATTCIAT